MDIVFLRQAHRFIKKANPALKEKIRKEVFAIQAQPNLGKLLKGRLRPLRAHRFVFSKTQYRIAYKVEGNVIVVVIASRENFYRDLRL